MTVSSFCEDDYIQLSALQHYSYCPRQCALIHVEQTWEENIFTAEGRLLHTIADSGGVTVRGNLKTATGVLLCSHAYGVVGKADVVEFHRKNGFWMAFPVEYKRGRPKKLNCDKVQLCMQALCLEDMLGEVITAGALYYGQSRRRQDVFFSPELREETVALTKAVHNLMRRGTLPLPVDDERCPSCSLLMQCMPGAVVPGRARNYLKNLWNES